MFRYINKNSGQIIELRREIKEFKGRLENYVLLESIVSPEEIEEIKKEQERQEYKDKIKEERLKQSYQFNNVDFQTEGKLYNRTIIIEEILED